VFDNSIKVPLLMKIPGVGALAVAQPVQNLDIVPTVLDYLGLGTGGEVFEGRSLRPVLEEGSGASGELQYALQGTFRSAADGRHKLIQDLATGTASLYDLEADPGEKADVLRRDRRTYFRLRDALSGWVTRAEGKGTGDESVRKAREAEERLRSLGYIE
jgi:arylsulfatase A-like enzyme